MCKKGLSALLAVCMAALFVFAAAADGLPFDKVPAAPGDMQFVFSYPNEGSECIEAVYTVPDELCRVATLSSEGQMRYYNGDFDVCIQFDWAVDDKDAFHYDESWDTVNGSYPIQKIDGSCVQQTEVFWFAYDEAAERCAPGVLETDGARVFDFDHHSLTVRARFFVYDYKSEKCTFSDWSEARDVGKDRGAKPEKIPTVGDERLTISKGTIDPQNPGVLTFDLRIPETVRRTLLVLKRDYATELNLESQVRFDDGDWQYWIMMDELYPYLIGQRQISVDPSALDGKIEYRCRLTGGNPDLGTAVTVGWSDILTIEGGNVRMAVNDDPFDEKIAEAERIAAEKEANKCKVCGICPHPLGLCLFIWIGIVLVVGAIAAYNIIAHKKKVAKQELIRQQEERSREGSAIDTGSFINTDRITLNKKQEDHPEEEKPIEDNKNEDETQEENDAD